MKRLTNSFATLLVLLAAGEASAVTITFEEFNLGDGLATVNAAVAPLGIAFDAAFPASFEVVLDPGNALNKVIRAKPFGAAGAVDIVANFTAPVERVSAEFVSNPDPVTVIVLEAYIANQNAGSINTSDFAFSDVRFASSGVLELVWSDVFAPPSQIRAATMGVASGGAPDFNYVDNITFEFVPEPTIVTELLIDSPPETLQITGDVEIAAGAEVGVTPGYSQASGTIESILAVTHTGVRTGLFANEGEHLRDGLFVDTITYNPNEILIGLLQALPGDTNGDREIDNTDIVGGILGANSFGNGPGFDWTQGDFSGDTEVTNDDILAILATGKFGTGPYAANPTEPGTPADGVADLVIHTDGTATLDTNGLAINGFILRSLGSNFTGSATLPFAFFQTNEEDEASVGFATPPVTGLVELGQLYKPGSLPISFGDLDFTYTVANTAGLFDGNCIGCVPEPSTIVLLVIGLVGIVGLPSLPILLRQKATAPRPNLGRVPKRMLL